MKPQHRSTRPLVRVAAREFPVQAVVGIFSIVCALLLYALL